MHNANGSLAVHNASVALGQRLAAVRPDSLWLITPHGLEVTRDFVLYQNTLGAGSDARLLSSRTQPKTRLTSRLGGVLLR